MYYPVLNRSPIFTVQPLFHQSPDQTYIKQLHADCNNPLRSAPNVNPYNSYVHEGEEEANVSQIPCAQPSAILDRELQNLPRDAYINKLVSIAMASESEISGYRDVLLRRAQQLPNCPDGKRIQRRGSRRNPVFTKLASSILTWRY